MNQTSGAFAAVGGHFLPSQARTRITVTSIHFRQRPLVLRPTPPRSTQPALQHRKYFKLKLASISFFQILTPLRTVTAPGATPDSYCQCGNVMAGYRTDTSVVDRTTYKYTACALETPFTFATETITPTPVATPLCGNYCLSFGTDNQPRAFSRDQGKDAIEKFCGLQNGAGDNFPSAQDYSIKASDPKAGSSRERFWYGKYCSNINRSYTSHTNHTSTFRQGYRRFLLFTIW